MLRKLRPRSAYDVMAAIAFFIAVAGGTAYAANTIGSSDVIDESLLSQDVKNGEVKNPDIGTNSVTSSRIATGNVFNSDLANDSVTGAKVVANTLTASDLGPDSVSTSELKDGQVSQQDLSADAKPRMVEFDGKGDDKTQRTVLTLGNLQLSAKCSGAGGPSPEADLFVYVKNIGSQDGQLNAGRE